MGSASSKKLRSVSVSKIDDAIKPSHPPRSSSVPSNLGSIKARQHGPSNRFASPSQQNGQPQVPGKVVSPEIYAMETPKQPPKKVDADGSLVTEGQEWTIVELYNVLVAESWMGGPELYSPNYLLLLDCRSLDKYEESHIITAKHHKALHTEFGCLLSSPNQLREFSMVVVHDDGDGSVCASLEAENIAYYKLHACFSLFQAKYPFLCTSKTISSKEQRATDTKTWPSEVLEACLYQGTAKHASSEEVVENLGITHIINITLDQPNLFRDKINYMTMRLDDESQVDLSCWIPKTSRFIQDAIGNPFHKGKKCKNRVLVHCNMGRSRSSTIVLGYLMQVLKWSLKDASEWLKDCRNTAKPNIGFLEQLLSYEKNLFGRKLSDFKDLPF